MEDKYGKKYKINFRGKGQTIRKIACLSYKLFKTDIFVLIFFFLFTKLAFCNPINVKITVASDIGVAMSRFSLTCQGFQC